ncbi:hypothetical protein ACOI1H_08110 [Loktanella sp. DJP18]|uniref:hypothetical protein n=1 Tax=Loktanella sp. DJP18 TaxID=3409788 RepID=UPI003BB8036F
MKELLPQTLFERQVELTKFLLERMHGIDSHLTARVQPYLPEADQYDVTELIEVLDDEEQIDPNLHFYVDAVLGEMRLAIAAGTHDEQVPISPEHLIGCAEGFDTRKVRTPEAEALHAALPPLEGLYVAAREAIEFATAIRLSLHLLHAY